MTNLLQGPFSEAQLLRILNNADIRAPLRPSAAKYFAVFVDRTGVVVLVMSSKNRITIDEASGVVTRECPGTAFFLAECDSYKTELELHEKIDDCIMAFQLPPSQSEMETRIVDGKNVVVIGGNAKSGQRSRPH